MSGDCFKAAADAAAFGPAEGWTLVHGIPTGKAGAVAGKRFAHAWVERDGIVRDVSNGSDVSMPRGLYYGLGNIEEDECVRYSRDEAMIEMLRTEHYGPWDARFYADDVL